MTDKELCEWFKHRADGASMPKAREAFVAAADAFKERIERQRGCDWCKSCRSCEFYGDCQRDEKTPAECSEFEPHFHCCPMCGRELKEDPNE